MIDRARFRVTVSSGVDPRLADQARAAAARWGVPYLERPHKTALTALAQGPEAAFLVLGADGWALWEHGAALRSSPGMAALRIKRLNAGKADDTLVRLAELQPGDRVLDCTFGLGCDALVCARAVGPRGLVVGVEKSFGLWALGQGALEGPPRFADLAPLELALADHLDHLRAQAPASFEVVLFDPMFGRPQRASPAFEVLRRHAEPAPLAPEALAEARRVARRWVLVKGAKYSRDLRALGLAAEPGARASRLIWGRVGPTRAP